MTDSMFIDGDRYPGLFASCTANGAVFAPELALCVGGFGDMILSDDSHLALEEV